MKIFPQMLQDKTPLNVTRLNTNDSDRYLIYLAHEHRTTCVITRRQVLAGFHDVEKHVKYKLLSQLH